MSKIEGFRAMAHPLEQLGDERFAALIDSANTGKVKDFCDQLLKDAIPTSMTIGDRTYDILGFLRGNETSVGGHTMVERAKEMNAHHGEDDGQYLLDNQQDIPEILRGKVIFVFTDWRPLGFPEAFYGVDWDWDSRQWVQRWFWLIDRWVDRVRVLRRK